MQLVLQKLRAGVAPPWEWAVVTRPAPGYGTRQRRLPMGALRASLGHMSLCDGCDEHFCAKPPPPIMRTLAAALACQDCISAGNYPPPVTSQIITAPYILPIPCGLGLRTWPHWSTSSATPIPTWWRTHRPAPKMSWSPLPPTVTAPNMSCSTEASPCWPSVSSVMTSAFMPGQFLLTRWAVYL